MRKRKPASAKRADPDDQDTFGPFVVARRWFATLSQLQQVATFDQISLRAAGVAFFFFLALMPALAAVAGIYGLVADPSDVFEQVDRLEGIVPDEAIHLVESEMEAIANSGHQAGWGLTLGLALAVWGSSKGMDALIRALNAVYRERETRGFVRRKLVALSLTLGGILFLALVVGLLAITPWALGLAGMSGLAEKVLGILRWPALFLIVSFALAVIYRLAPYHKRPDHRFFSIGTFVAATVWVLASAALSAYIAQIATFSKTYGSLAAVVTLMFWFYLSALIVLLGGELNAILERRAAGLPLLNLNRSIDETL
jgi:membrane protein